jgi:hypothetical protein
MKLSDFAQMWDCSNDFTFAFYYDRVSDEVIVITEEDIRHAENFETEEEVADLSEVDREQVMLGWEAIYGGERLVVLPENKTQETYELMKAFAHNLEAEAREVVLQLIRGKGAFGRFDYAIDRFDVRQEWYDFRDAGYERIMKEWCDRCDIPYEESDLERKIGRRADHRSKEPVTKSELSTEEEINYNILNFIRTIHLNGQDFIESEYNSAFFGELPMTFKKKSGQVVGIITATVDGEVNRYVFNENGYEDLDELLML